MKKENQESEKETKESFPSKIGPRDGYNLTEEQKEILREHGKKSDWDGIPCYYQGRRISKHEKFDAFEDRGQHIDFDLVFSFMEMQCTLAEVAGYFKLDVDTLNNKLKKHFGQTYGKLFEIYSGSGRISLRRIQFRQAETSVPMAIHLGKSMLGQSEKVQQTIEVKQEIVSKRILELPDNGRRRIEVEATIIDNEIEDDD